MFEHLDALAEDIYLFNQHVEILFGGTCSSANLQWLKLNPSDR